MEGTDLVSTDPAVVSTALRAHARGLHAAEAAVELLLAHQHWLCRTDFLDGFVHRCPAEGRAAGLMFIDWDELAQALACGQIACSGGERRMLQAALSLAAGFPVDLRDTATGVDGSNLCILATAVLHAGGRRPDSLSGGGKMSGLWSGQPNGVRLDELDVVCAVLGCGIEEMLIPEPEKVAAPASEAEQAPAAVGQNRPVIGSEDYRCEKQR